jgi:hypothetical protein
MMRHSEVDICQTRIYEEIVYAPIVLAVIKRKSKISQVDIIADVISRQQKKYGVLTKL